MIPKKCAALGLERACIQRMNMDRLRNSDLNLIGCFKEVNWVLPAATDLD